MASFRRNTTASMQQQNEEVLHKSVTSSLSSSCTTSEESIDREDNQEQNDDDSGQHHLVKDCQYDHNRFNRYSLPRSFSYGRLEITQIYPRLDSTNSSNCCADNYPGYFRKGSSIHLGKDKVKRIEDLTREDFVASINLYPELKLETSTVVFKNESVDAGRVILGFATEDTRDHIHVEFSIEHPFFVIGRGWSSCHPEYTAKIYQLKCHLLSIGDVCMSLSLTAPIHSLKVIDG